MVESPRRGGRPVKRADPEARATDLAVSSFDVDNVRRSGFRGSRGPAKCPCSQTNLRGGGPQAVCDPTGRGWKGERLVRRQWRMPQSLSSPPASWLCSRETDKREQRTKRYKPGQDHTRDGGVRGEAGAVASLRWVGVG